MFGFPAVVQEAPAAVQPAPPEGAGDTHAKIRCTILADGKLANCNVISQDSPEAGSRALKLSSLLKMKPKMLDGRPVAGGTVMIPLRFHNDLTVDSTAPPPVTPTRVAPNAGG